MLRISFELSAIGSTETYICYICFTDRQNKRRHHMDLSLTAVAPNLINYKWELGLQLKNARRTTSADLFRVLVQYEW